MYYEFIYIIDILLLCYLNVVFLLTLTNLYDYIIIQQAVDLEKKDLGGKSDPYCIITYEDYQSETKVIGLKSF